MENKEIKIIEILDKNKNLSQRDIAKEANLSLGVVNTLIKTCVKKGLIKIERLNSRNIKYLLTPQGINEKAKKTFNYVKRSYGTIMKLRDYFIDVKEDLDNNKVWIYDMDESMQEVIEMILSDIGISYEEYDKDRYMENDFIIKWNGKRKKNEIVIVAIIN